MQCPLEQSIWQLPSLGHDVLQPPEEQSTVHGPAPHQLTHLPLEQWSVHMPVCGQVFEQSPEEQLTSHGAIVHVFAHPPLWQLHEPPLHWPVVRTAASAARVSGTAGPPFGVPPSLFGIVVPEPPHPRPPRPARHSST